MTAFNIKTNTYEKHNPYMHICLCSLQLFAQRTVEGVVKDETGLEALIGANVVQKGTTNGTITFIRWQIQYCSGQ